jgi:3-carboxy-cis,cis-muconate cycloisomerase
VTDLFWPGDERAGSLMSDLALLQAMEAVESAWLAALVDAGIAPASAQHPVRGLVGPDDLDTLSRGAESGGNPVIGLVALLRERLGPADAARWLHRGLTSQDVVDSALMLLVRDTLDEVVRQLDRQVQALVTLAQAHRDTVMVGRTLTQHAVPTTFGLKAATWLTGVLDCADRVTAVRSRLGVQAGGAVGTMAAATELARLQGAEDPATVAIRLASSTAATLGLPPRMPWHTTRAPVTAVGDALVTCTDAWGHLAADVATMSRPEIGELDEGRGGGSSTMPGKRNPVLSVLVRRAALAGPPLASTLHLAAATTVDERPDGAWHAEWAALRDLGRRTVVAGSQTTDLLVGLHVHPDRMRATLESASDSDAEQASMAALVGRAPSDSYRGATSLIIDAALERARTTRPGPVPQEAS